MYLAGEINEILESKRKKLVGWNGYYEITRALNGAFKQKDLKFRHESFKDFDKNEYSVSGLYDSFTNTKYVILNFSDKHLSFRLNNTEWEDFKFNLSQVIQHETIHQIQAERRPSDNEPVHLDFRVMSASPDEDKEYLSDPDEIDAYAHDIAMEIKYFYPKDNPYNILKTIDKRRKLWSYTYYKRTFRKDDWFLIKKNLLKKTYCWLPYVTV